MSVRRIRIGTVEVGKVEKVADSSYIAYRVSGAGEFVRVGDTRTEIGAFNLVATSLIANSINPPTLNPTQRQKVAQLGATLIDMGLADLAKAIDEALK